MKMKRFWFSLLTMLILMLAVACGKKEVPTEDADTQQQGATNEVVQDYHIGVVTISVSQAEDNFRGAEAVAKKYGLSTEGGKITVVTIPDNFMQEQETTISQMVSLADDPKMKAIVVAEGVPGAQQFILEQVPNWISKYGKDIAFFATNDAQTEPLLKQIAAHGGYFIEADLPSPTMGYPGALGIEFSDDEKGNWPKILEKVEKSVVEAGGSGRMGTWAYSYNFAGVEGLTDLAIKSIESGDRDFTLDKLLASVNVATPGAKWNGSIMKDNNGVDVPNAFFIYQDTYVFGKGYMGVTSIKIPEKYTNLGN